jgi:beta-xylosidase
VSATAAGPRHPYLDASLPGDARVDDLLSRMTLDEKLAQLGSAWVFELMSGEAFSPERAKQVCRHGIGQISRVAGASSLGPAAAAEIANRIQSLLVEETRLGIPAIIHEEICSGVMARGSTVFPQAIGMAATFDPELNRRMADVMRVQMRAGGSHQGLSPVLDVTRDPRWGRTEETYGEDPHLVARMGVEFVKGLQGESLADGVIATAKHFVGYGASEGGLNWAPAHIGARELKEVYLHPFEAAVVEGGVRSIMNGYHEIDGVPCAANGQLMNDLLRDTWGFDGIIVSDYFAVDQLATYHRLATDKSEAAVLALTSGIDSELPSSDCYVHPLAMALDDGDIDLAIIDESVRRILGLKFELGLFEHPYVDVEQALASVDTPEQQALALEAARSSIVLLANDGILPLAPDHGRIAVIGPNADSARNLFGDYAYPAHIESLLEMRDERNVFDVPIPQDVHVGHPALLAPSILAALRSRFGTRVEHAMGCAINDSDRSGIAAAVDLASRSDVVVLVLGDKAGLTVACTSGEGRDRSSLELPGVQEELARAVIATGTPVVVVLVVGRPCGSEELIEGAAATLLGWLPGQEGGRAIADVLAGDVNPGGKLPMSFPRHVGQVPVFYGHKASGGRSHWQGDYVDGPTTPMFPFGHGLSYTTFELLEPVVESPDLRGDDTIGVTVDLVNTGDVDGSEVVQVYVRHPDASITRPVLELVGFARVGVTVGSSRRVRFDIPRGQLGFYGADLEYVVEEGQIEVLVGTSADELVTAGQVHLGPGEAVVKMFDGQRTIG